MTDEDKETLAADIADELLDSCGLDTKADRELTARVIADRVETTLRQLGWRPPETYDRIIAWSAQTARLPEHHINQSVLMSQLAELTQILKG